MLNFTDQSFTALIYYAHCRVWDRELGCEVASLPHEDVVNSVAFCPRDQELMVSGGDDHKYVVTTVQCKYPDPIHCFQDQSLDLQEKKERSRTETETIADIVKLRSEIVIINLNVTIDQLKEFTVSNVMDLVIY